MEILLSLVVLFAIGFVLTNEYYQQKMGVSCMPSTAHIRREIIALVPQLQPGRIVELGSGWGGICIALARDFPDREVVGIENSFFPFCYGWLRQKLWRLPNLTLRRMDFFKSDFRGTALTVCYLSNPIMKRLAPKFKDELPPGSVLISSTFFVPGWVPERVLDVTGVWNTRIFVYRKGAPSSM